jgi:hypothetical protein
MAGAASKDGRHRELPAYLNSNLREPLVEVFHLPFINQAKAASANRLLPSNKLRVHL